MYRLCIYMHEIGEEKVVVEAITCIYTLNMVLCPLSGNTAACGYMPRAGGVGGHVVVCTCSVNKQCRG